MGLCNSSVEHLKRPTYNDWEYVILELASQKSQIHKLLKYQRKYIEEHNHYHQDINGSHISNFNESSIIELNKELNHNLSSINTWKKESKLKGLLRVLNCYNLTKTYFFFYRWKMSGVDSLLSIQYANRKIDTRNQQILKENALKAQYDIQKRNRTEKPIIVLTNFYLVGLQLLNYLVLSYPEQF